MRYLPFFQILIVATSIAQEVLANPVNGALVSSAPVDEKPKKSFDKNPPAKEKSDKKPDVTFIKAVEVEVDDLELNLKASGCSKSDQTTIRRDLNHAREVVFNVVKVLES